MPQLGPLELLVVMGLAVLLFGKRLPEVGRSLGKGIIEFKKGLRGIEDNFDFSSDGPFRRNEDRPHSASTSSSLPDSSVPKFEPPTSAPVPQMEYEPQSTPQD